MHRLQFQAEYEYYVDSGILTFVNHGCNGTNNIGEEDTMHFTEDIDLIDLLKLKSPPSSHIRRSTLDLVIDRHLPSFAVGYDESSRDIKAGEELLQNYMYFMSCSKHWKLPVLDLQAQCRGEVLGQVRQDEIEALVKEEEDSHDDDEDDKD